MFVGTIDDSVPLPEELDGKSVFVLHHFLSPEECLRLIATSEALGYEEASLNTRFGPVIDRSYRNNTRILYDNPDLASAWWARARSFVPRYLNDWEAVGLNERFRFYRYNVGEAFRPHFDGYFRRENGEQSQLTFLVYLNEACEGGETGFYFPDGQPRFEVRPETGKALVFAHRQVHEGKAILNGTKYVLRTDILYRPAASRK